MRSRFVENFDSSKTFDRSKNSIHRKFYLSAKHTFNRSRDTRHAADHVNKAVVENFDPSKFSGDFRLIFLFQSTAFFVVNCNRVKYFKYSKYYACNSYATITVFNFQGYSLTHSSCNPLCFLHCQESVWVTDDVYQTVFLNECTIEFLMISRMISVENLSHVTNIRICLVPKENFPI